MKNIGNILEPITMDLADEIREMSILKEYFSYWEYIVYNIAALTSSIVDAYEPFTIKK